MKKSISLMIAGIFVAGALSLFAQGPAADKLAEELAENWKLERLAAIDRSILRLAIYELRSETAPVNVVIDEALELAKKFSSAEAPAFLNGILGAALKQIKK